MISIVDQLIYGLQPTRENLWLAYEALSSRRTVEAKGSDSVYEYLYNNSGSQEAASLAALLLCQRMGLEGQLVKGSDQEGNSHTWLAVYMKDTWCHLDPTGENTEESFLRSDEEMKEWYSWDGETVPVCPGLPVENQEEGEEPLPLPEAEGSLNLAAPGVH